MATNNARRKRIGESKLFDLVHSYKFAKSDDDRRKFWNQIVDEVEVICEAEPAPVK
jgi:hypothetical protein